MPKDPRLYLTLVLPLQRGGMTGSVFGRKYVTEWLTHTKPRRASSFIHDGYVQSWLKYGPDSRVACRIVLVIHQYRNPR